MNLCAQFWMMVLATVNAERTERRSRGLKVHSSIIEEAFSLNATEPKGLQLEGVVTLKKEKTLEYDKASKATPEEKSTKTSSDKLKREDTELDKTDDAKAESMNKKVEVPKSPTLAPKKQKSKGCRRLVIGVETGKKKVKGSKKLQQKNSSLSFKGRDKLEKSVEDKADDDDDDDGAYSHGTGQFKNNSKGGSGQFKNNSKGDKVHIDDFVSKKDKEEKYSDDNNDECEEGTDPPEPSRAPSPGIPSSEEDIDISLSPYFVLYDIQQTRIPLLTEYDELATFTSGYLDNYFRSIFADMPEIAFVGSRTTLLESEFRLAQPVRIDYATNVTFTSTSLIPGTSELETIAQGAFEGENGVSYATAVAAGVGANNIFSTTSSVSYVLTESINFLPSTSTRVESAIYAINATLIAFVVLLYRCRSKEKSSSSSGGKSLVDSHDGNDEQRMRNRIEGWNVGLAPVLSSMKVSLSSVRKKKKSRGTYKTVDKEAETS